MIRRTTIELDYDLVGRAQVVLKCPTVRATIHEALRRAIDDNGTDNEKPPRGSAAAVLAGVANMRQHLDLDVLASNHMWR